MMGREMQGFSITSSNVMLYLLFAVVAKGSDWARRAFGGACGADISSKPDDAVTEVGTFLRVKKRRHDALDLGGISFVLGVCTKPSADADEMGVGDDGGLAEYVAEQKVRDLSADAREEKKLLHGVG